MHWVLALAGAFLGALAGGADASFLGLCVGALLAWQAARIGELNRRLAALDQQGRVLQARLDALRVAPVMVDGVPAATATARSPDSAREVDLSAAPVRPAAPVAKTEAAADFAARLAAASADVEVAPPLAAKVNASAASVSGTAPPRRPPPLPQPAPQSAPPSAAEGAIDRLLLTLRGWLFEGNVPVKIGVLLLFFGLAAAMRYAVEQGLVSFPIELRLSAIAAAAIGGLLWGWRNRTLRPEFGLALQGGAIGVLLLTVFASYRLYSLLPSGVAFALVLVLVAAAALLAVLQNAVALAVLGFVGGYLGPVLISSGSGNHVALFSYYALLNAAVFAIAWLRPWRALNLVGFGFTFAIGSMWGARYYRPELFASVEPFLILFFLFYVFIAVFYALRGDATRRALVDGTLVFGTPLLAFPLQAGLLRDDSMGLAWSAIAVATLYAGLAWWLLRNRRVPLLGQSFAALALGFATLAVPLALSARWTSASWAVEGAALVWLGLRQHRLLPQLSGWALQVLALVAYGYSLVDGGWESDSTDLFLLNGHALSVLLMALSAFFLSWLHERHGGGRLIVWPAFALGLFWWCVGGVRELAEFHSQSDPSLLFVAFAAVSATLAALLRGWIAWPRLGWIAVGVSACGLPLVLATEADIGALRTLPQHGVWLLWFAAMALALWRLREPRQRGLSIAHVASLATAALLYGLAMAGWAARNELADGWTFVATLLPLMLIMLASWKAPVLACWPLADQFAHYRLRWFVPAGAVLALAWVAALAQRGDSSPLPFVPLINPVELFQIGVLLVAIRLAQRAHARDLLALCAGAGLLFVTFAALRAVHHLHGAPWSPAMLDDQVAQATLTVVWSLAGVLAWVIGSRRRNWGVWLSGAVLMGVVLIKLLLIDRRYFGDLAGIVSFMAVGGLLVLVGRIAPTPPRRAEPLENEP